MASKQCVICEENFDESKMDKHETLDGKTVIHVCDTCYDHNALYDEYNDRMFIDYNDEMFYRSSGWQ